MQNILKVTGADGIMVGRASIGQPEIFSELCFDKIVEVNKLEQIKVHYNQLKEFYGELYTVKYMRSHLAYYLSGKYKNTQALVKLLKMEKFDEIFDYLNIIMK